MPKKLETLSIYELIRRKHPKLEEYYPDINLENLPRKTLERLASGQNIIDILGESQSLFCRIEQREELLRKKLEHPSGAKGYESKTPGTPKTSIYLRGRNSGGSDIKYHG